MFEKFTSGAREVVRGAVEYADREGTGSVGERELLLSLLDRRDTPAAAALTALGMDAARRASLTRDLEEARRRGGLSSGDVAALAGLGIDVDAIVGRVEEAHGAGALAPTGTGKRRGRWTRRFAPEAKAVLERALRVATGRGDRHIGDEHLLLALTARVGIAATVLADHGVTFVGIERTLARRAQTG